MVYDSFAVFFEVAPYYNRFLKNNMPFWYIYCTSPDCLIPFGPHVERCGTYAIVLFSHLEGCSTWVMVPFGSHLEVLVPLGTLVRIATTRPTTRYATMVIPSYEVSAASGALVESYKQALVKPW